MDLNNTLKSEVDTKIYENFSKEVFKEESVLAELEKEIKEFISNQDILNEKEVEVNVDDLIPTIRQFQLRLNEGLVKFEELNAKFDTIKSNMEEIEIMKIENRIELIKIRAWVSLLDYKLSNTIFRK